MLKYVKFAIIAIILLVFVKSWFDAAMVLLGIVIGIAIIVALLKKKPKTNGNRDAH